MGEFWGNLEDQKFNFSDRVLEDNLREFALCYERHPESVRTVPRLCPAGCDSVSAASAASSASAGVCLAALPFLCFRSFNLPQHRSQNPFLPVFYANQHRSKSFPSCVLGIVVRVEILPFLCSRRNKKVAWRVSREGEAKNGRQKSSRNR